MARCKIHDKELICPSCRAAEGGRKGGLSRSPKKVKQFKEAFSNNPNMQKYLGKK